MLLSVMGATIHSLAEDTRNEFHSCVLSVAFRDTCFKAEINDCADAGGFTWPSKTCVKDVCLPY